MEPEWNIDGDAILNILSNNDIPTINSSYIDAIFGEGKNGIRERAWLRFESGHLNVETLINHAYHTPIDLVTSVHPGVFVAISFFCIRKERALLNPSELSSLILCLFLSLYLSFISFASGYSKLSVLLSARLWSNRAVGANAC